MLTSRADDVDRGILGLAPKRFLIGTRALHRPGYGPCIGRCDPDVIAVHTELVGQFGVAGVAPAFDIVVPDICGFAKDQGGLRFTNERRRYRPRRAARKSRLRA
jgi:hypothetical protein